jgi:hypothetical protein
MECKETSSFKYKRRIDVEKWFDELYDGKFGIHRCTLSNGEYGVIHIHNTETKEHIASLVKNVLYTNNLSFI